MSLASERLQRDEKSPSPFIDPANHTEALRSFQAEISEEPVKLHAFNIFQLLNKEQQFPHELSAGACLSEAVRLLSHFWLHSNESKKANLVHQQVGVILKHAAHAAMLQRHSLSCLSILDFLANIARSDSLSPSDSVLLREWCTEMFCFIVECVKICGPSCHQDFLEVVCFHLKTEQNLSTTFLELPEGIEILMSLLRHHFSEDVSKLRLLLSRLLTNKRFSGQFCQEGGLILLGEMALYSPLFSLGRLSLDLIRIIYMTCGHEVLNQVRYHIPQFFVQFGSNVETWEKRARDVTDNGREASKKHKTDDEHSFAFSLKRKTQEEPVSDFSSLLPGYTLTVFPRPKKQVKHTPTCISTTFTTCRQTESYSHQENKDRWARASLNWIMPYDLPHQVS